MQITNMHEQSDNDKFIIVLTSKLLSLPLHLFFTRRRAALQFMHVSRLRQQLPDQTLFLLITNS
jgi:hypothetical protein